MSKDVLILGNGLSRLLHEEFIDRWVGELWACNYAFKRYGPRLTRLTGHVEAMAEAKKCRQEHGWTFEVWGGNLGAFGVDKVLTCPREFWKDSGTTMVAQALHERRRVWVVGFDLGGMDVLSPGIENTDKSCWVNRWRAIAARWSLKDVTFVGMNHKSFVLGRSSPAQYAKFYRAGRPHISDPAYLKLWSERTGRKGSAPELDFEVVDVVMLIGPDKGQTRSFRRDVARHLVNKNQARVLTEGVTA